MTVGTPVPSFPHALSGNPLLALRFGPKSRVDVELLCCGFLLESCRNDGGDETAWRIGDDVYIRTGLCGTLIASFPHALNENPLLVLRFRLKNHVDDELLYCGFLLTSRRNDGDDGYEMAYRNGGDVGVASKVSHDIPVCMVIKFLPTNPAIADCLFQSGRFSSLVSIFSFASRG
ncbi:hypothetical protein [Nitrosomonas ureae]|uniref:hypothetical protein n=1 Tax=Nitrosomonas ureae TaxID=44577 RepID=UPI001160857C|nr:hypothetical protein [Nitrosomonas ureae]